MRKTQTRGKASITRRQEAAAKRAAEYAALTRDQKLDQQAKNDMHYRKEQ